MQCPFNIHVSLSKEPRGLEVPVEIEIKTLYIINMQIRRLLTEVQEEHY